MKGFIGLSGLLFLSVLSTAAAAVSDAEFEALKRQVEANTAAVSNEAFQALKRQVEANTAAIGGRQAAPPSQQGGVDGGTFSADDFQSLQQQVDANSVAVEKSGWAQRIKFEGDFRYRYQNDDVSSVVGESDRTRNRNRIRARAALTAKLDDDWSVGLGFASGGDDPVSTNQTLGGGGSTKDINLDLGYFDYTGFENTSVRGGKFKRTLKAAGKSQLQWDGDWRPEGFDVAWENDRFFAQGMGTYIESDDSKSNNEFSYLLQAGTKLELGSVKLLTGIGYTEIGAKNLECFFDQDDGGCFGNESVPIGGGDAGYLYDFEVYNVFAEAGFEAGGLPVTIFGDFIKNDAADNYDSGYLVGAQLGKVKKAGSWQVKAYYEEIESNATLALLTNSDFGGGGTNGEGTVLSAGYGITDQVSFGATYFMVDRNTDRRSEINDGQEFSVDTLQVDLKFKYK